MSTQPLPPTAQATTQGAPLKIPRHWTPAQALAVLECLQMLRQAMWDVYGADVQQAWREQLVPDGPPPEFDPDEPF